MNPYAAPVADADPRTASSEEERIRRHYLGHEANVRAVGSLCIFWALMLMYVALFGVWSAEGTTSLVVALVCLLMGGASMWLGIGLRQLNPKVKTPSIVLAIIGLLGFPVGTVVSLFVLYLLLSGKGHMVFSEEYARIRAATPYIRHKVSGVVWALLGLFILAIGSVILSMPEWPP